MEDMIYKEKKLTISQSGSWAYNDIEDLKIKEINEILYNEINNYVKNYLENYKKIKEEEQQKRKEEILKINTEKCEKFKLEFLNKYNDLVKDLNIRFATPGYDRNFEEKRFFINSGITYSDIEIEYNDRVWDDYRLHKTNRVWQLTDFNMKRIRYNKLETAIKKAKQLILEKNQKIIEKQENENKQKIEEKKLKYFAEKNGFTFEKNYISRKYSNGYYSYYMKKDYILADIKYINDEVKIISYRVFRENITIDEINTILKLNNKE